MKKSNLRKTVFAALFLAMGMVFPLLTSQIKEIGDTLLPMHIPVMLCGFICGWKYGLSVGFILPFLRSAIFGMPPVYPNAVWMAFELGTYGLVAGLLYSKGKSESIGYLYFCLIVSMLSGRAVWGIAKAVLLGFGDKAFTLAMFITGGFTDAFLGIVVQLALVPVIVRVYEIYKLKG